MLSPRTAARATFASDEGLWILHLLPLLHTQTT